MPLRQIIKVHGAQQVVVDEVVCVNLLNLRGAELFVEGGGHAALEVPISAVL